MFQVEPGVLRRQVGDNPTLQLCCFTLYGNKPTKTHLLFYILQDTSHVLLYFLTAANFSDVPGPCHTVKKRQGTVPSVPGMQEVLQQETWILQSCLPNARFPLGMAEDTVCLANVLSSKRAFSPIPSFPAWAKLLSLVPYWDLRRNPSSLVGAIKCRGRQETKLRSVAGPGWVGGG